MALIKCPECGREISDKAVSCPGCGCPASEFSHIEKEEEKLCPFCGEKLVLEDGYCSSCGIKYTEEQASTKKRIDGFGGAIEYDEKFVSIESPIGNTLIRDQITAFSFDYTGNNLFIRHKAFKGPVMITLKAKNDLWTIMEDLQADFANSTQPNPVVQNTATLQNDSYKKGSLFTKIKCPKCWSIEFEVIDTKKKFSLGKALIGNTVGGLILGPAGAVAGTFQGVNGKNGKTKFVCSHCGHVWEQQI